MLKDELLRLKKDSGSDRKFCGIAKAFQEMDDETKTVFLEVMASPAFTTDIAKALRADGFPISRDTLSRKRKCFKKENTECCMLENRPQ